MSGRNNKLIEKIITIALGAKPIAVQRNAYRDWQVAVEEEKDRQARLEFKKEITAFKRWGYKEDTFEAEYGVMSFEDGRRRTTIEVAFDEDFTFEESLFPKEPEEDDEVENAYDMQASEIRDRLECLSPEGICDLLEIDLGKYVKQGFTKAQYKRIKEAFSFE